MSIEKIKINGVFKDVNNAVIGQPDFTSVPDYSSMETTNRISTNNGTWTADRSGFVQCMLHITSATGSGLLTCAFYVNDKVVEENTLGVTIVQTTNRTLSVIPITKGDVVKLSALGTAGVTMVALSCYFIPPKFVNNVDIDYNGTEYVQGSFGTTTLSNAAYTIVPLVVQNGGKTAWVSGNTIVVPENGVYIMSARIPYIGSSTVPSKATSIYINGSIYGYANTANSNDTSTAASGYYPTVTLTRRLTKGDVIDIRGYYNSATAISVPAGGVWNVTRLQVASSTNENIPPVGQEINTGKTNYDGKTIYRQTFTGNIVSAANIRNGTELLSGINQVISANGTYQDGSANTLIPIGSALTAPTAVNTQTVADVRFNNGTATLYSISFTERVGTINNAYVVWLEYTK